MIQRGLAFIGLVVSFPIGVLIAILIKLESRGPVFYRQERVGKNGRIFEVIKFRSMRTDAELDGTPVWATDNDDRVTRVGKLIRKIRVDEIPQFWNILKGEMNFVGPRPERPHFVKQLAAEISRISRTASCLNCVTNRMGLRPNYGTRLPVTPWRWCGRAIPRATSLSAGRSGISLHVRI